jgi:hypothetical protein
MHNSGHVPRSQRSWLEPELEAGSSCVMVPSREAKT